MDEIIVRLARTIASLPRLRVLSVMARKPELPPSVLAAELGMPRNALSVHLRALAVAGLLQRRKSGAWSYYRAESPYNERTLSGNLTAWLKTMLQAPAESAMRLGLGEAQREGCTPEMLLHRTIFEAATAFTDLRRLQILRHLAGRGGSTAEQIQAALSISPQAVTRHMTKLIRRGYVQARRSTGRTLVYELSPTAKTPVHSRMLEIVRAVWDDKFRSS
jgi:DNA-binding transcriptional ArsR family regulator